MNEQPHLDLKFFLIDGDDSTSFVFNLERHLRELGFDICLWNKDFALLVERLEQQSQNENIIILAHRRCIRYNNEKLVDFYYRLKDIATLIVYSGGYGGGYTGGLFVPICVEKRDLLHYIKKVIEDLTRLQGG